MRGAAALRRSAFRRLGNGLQQVYPSLMPSRSDKTYQDPRAAGSLSSLLPLWRKLRSSRRDTAITLVTFTLSGEGESRATRVAGFLRRRRACAETRVHHVAGGGRDTWHVHGSLYPSIHSLPDLEATWTWLRRTAQKHHVRLLRIALAPAPA